MKTKRWLKVAGANGPRDGGAVAVTGRLEAAPHDAPGTMTWAGAKRWCDDGRVRAV